MTATVTAAPTAAPPQPAAPMMLRRQTAAEHCGVSVTAWDRMTKTGLNPAPIRVGGVFAWCRDELDAWCVHGCPARAEWAGVWELIRRSK